MPRTKGSRNKAPKTIEERIAATEAKIAELQEQLKAAKAELQSLMDMRNEEQLKTLADAIAASGKSISDVIAMVNSEEK